MACGQRTSCHHQHAAQQHFRHGGQGIADLHQRTQPEQIRGGNAQHLGMPELPKRFKLRFFIFQRQPVEGLIQLGIQILGGDPGIKQRGVQQFIQQYRVAGQPLGCPRASRTQQDQLMASLWVLPQQRQIGSASQHGLHQRKNAGQHLIMRQRLRVARQCIMSLNTHHFFEQ